MRRFLATGVVIFALLQVSALIGWLTLAPALAESISVNRWFEAAVSAVWAVLFGVMGVRLWRRTVTLWQGTVLLCVFSIYIALHTTLFARADYERQRVAVLWAIAISLGALTLMMRHQQRRAAKQQKEEDTSRNGH